MDILRISRHPELLPQAAAWFHGKWGIPLSAYEESMEVFVEPGHRCLGIAGQLLAFVCRDFHDRGIDTLYLLTDHDHFYERYGWTYHCPALGEGESVPSRLYRHVWQET